MFYISTMNILTEKMLNKTPNLKAFNNKKLYEKQNFNEQNQTINNTQRPAQPISFGGSAVSMASGFSKAANSLIDFVYENEAGYTAIYSLLVAGMLKPFFVLRMKGSEEKDKQIVATKNFLQAFIGSFLGFTVGGGFVKKAIDVFKNNLRLIEENEDKTGFVVTSDEKKLLKLAKSSLEKEKSGFWTRYNHLRDSSDDSKLKTFWQALTKKSFVGEKIDNEFNPDKQIFIKLTPYEIDNKIKQLKQTAQGHLKIFNKEDVVDFVIRLKENGDEKLIAKQKQSILDLINKGADKKEIASQYESLVKAILDSSLTGTKNAIKEKAKETEALLNKDTAKEALDKFFDFIKDKKCPESLMDTYESVWKQSTGWITAITKAKISSLLLPGVMAFLFMKRNAEKEKQKQMEHEAKRNAILSNSSVFNKEKNNFALVSENKKRQNVAFTGNSLKLIDKLAAGIETISFSKFGQKAVEVMHSLPKPFNKTSARMGDIESAIITAYWVQNTTRSKKIDPDQKLGLNVHTVFVTVVSSILAFLIDTLLDPVIDKMKVNHGNKLANAAKEALKPENAKNMEETLMDNCKTLLDGKHAVNKILEVIKNNKQDFFDANGKLLENTDLSKEIGKLVGDHGKKLTKFKSLTIFTLVVRFLVPVFSVPISGKLKQILKKKKQEKEAIKAQEDQKMAVKK